MISPEARANNSTEPSVKLVRNIGQNAVFGKAEIVIGPSDISKSTELFRGDINSAVIGVQLATGVEITESWWLINVGNDGSTEHILERFDDAYAELMSDRPAA
jgi:hypothetical protein